MTRPTSAPLAGLALAVATALAACNAGGGTTPSSTPSPVPSLAPTALPSVPTDPTADPSPSLEPFVCTLPLHAAATTDRAQITRVAVGTHPGYDRIVFEFATGLPEYTIELATPPFTADPSGLPLSVRGERFLHVVLHNGTRVLPDGTESYAGAVSFSPSYPILRDLQSAGDFEAMASWYVGLAADTCVRVLTLEGPSRLVIDLQQP